MLVSASRDYYRMEAARAPSRAAVISAVVGGATVLFDHALLVRFPPSVIRFMEEAYRIQGLASVLLVNDLLVPYFVTFFMAVGSLLDATVSAREEGRLELLLAKPVRPAMQLAARALPVLGTSVASGALVSLVIGVTLAPRIPAVDVITVRGAVGSSLLLVALATVLLSALLPAFVLVRERLYALLLASLTWLAPLLATGLFIYRPDVFDEHRYAQVLLLPCLLWNDATSAWLGPTALAASLPFALAMSRLAGRVLERRDLA